MKLKHIRQKVNLGRELLIIIFAIAIVLLVFYVIHRNLHVASQVKPHNALDPNGSLRCSSDEGSGKSEGIVAEGECLLASIEKTNHKPEKRHCHPDPSGHIPAYLPMGGLTIAADLLYWSANEDGLEYGTKIVGGPVAGENARTKSKLLDLDFEWNPGFRINLGYLFNHYDHYSLSASWTHIRNKAHGHHTAEGIESETGPVNTIISPWVNLLSQLTNGAVSAHASWHVDYDTVDLNFGRSFYLSKRFVLDPYFGLRGAQILQHYHAKYKTVFLPSAGQPSFVQDVTFKANNNFTAIGARGGTEMLWRLGKNWHLFSQLSANILYGKFNVHMKNINDQGLSQGGAPAEPLDYLATEKFWRVRLNFEEAIGLGWEVFFCKDKCHFALRAAYELSQWLNQNELFYTLYNLGQDTISNVPIRNQGDLSFQGLTVGFHLDF